MTSKQVTSVINAEVSVDSSNTFGATVKLSSNSETELAALFVNVSKTEERKRRSLIATMLLDSNANESAIKTSVAALGLQSKLSARSVYVVRSATNINAGMLMLDEAVYQPLRNFETTTIMFGSFVNMTVKRFDINNNQRYFVLDWTSSGDVSVRCNTSCLYFDLSNPANTSNYLIADETLIVANTYVFSIGSISVSLQPPSNSRVQGDPHITFAHGGKADFRGRNNTYFALLSAPGVQFAARTMDTSFLLPRPQLVHGSFFTDLAFRFQGTSGREYGVTSSASHVSFSVFDATRAKHLLTQEGIWKQWWNDGVRVVYKQATMYVRVHGWEINATRRPIYNYLSGPSRWRYDFAIRYLDGTPFEKDHGRRSTTCFPHGVIGQSWDGDGVGVNGRMDDYKYYNEHPTVTTVANAEGAIEGVMDDYALKDAFDVTTFRYGRYDKNATSVCASRDASKLSGPRVRGGGGDSIAQTTE